MVGIPETGGMRIPVEEITHTTTTELLTTELLNARGLMNTEPKFVYDPYLYFVRCADCDEPISYPFSTEEKRLKWVEAHCSATGHFNLKFRVIPTGSWLHNDRYSGTSDD